MKVRVYNGQMRYYRVIGRKQAERLITKAQRKGWFAEIVDDQYVAIKQYSVMVRKGEQR